LQSFNSLRTKFQLNFSGKALQFKIFREDRNWSKRLAGADGLLTAQSGLINSCTNFGAFHHALIIADFLFARRWLHDSWRQHWMTKI
jgi:hypothetical protein